MCGKKIQSQPTISLRSQMIAYRNKNLFLPIEFVNYTYSPNKWVLDGKKNHFKMANVSRRWWSAKNVRTFTAEGELLHVPDTRKARRQRWFQLTCSKKAAKARLVFASLTQVHVGGCGTVTNVSLSCESMRREFDNSQSKHCGSNAFEFFASGK